MAGRSKKVGAVEQPQLPEDTAALLRRLEMLERALVSAAAENQALKVAARSGTGDGVLIETTGLIRVCIPVDERTTVILEPKGSRRTAMIPVHVFNRLRRETDWFEKGYLFVSGEDTDNPNVIMDIAAWIAALPENKVTETVSLITSEGTLHRLWDHIEALETPGGKELLVKRAVSNRVATLLGYDLVEDSFGED